MQCSEGQVTLPAVAALCDFAALREPVVSVLCRFSRAGVSPSRRPVFLLPTSGIPHYTLCPSFQPISERKPWTTPSNSVT